MGDACYRLHRKDRIDRQPSEATFLVTSGRDWQTTTAQFIWRRLNERGIVPRSMGLPGATGDSSIYDKRTRTFMWKGSYGPGHLTTVCLALTGYLYGLFLARRKDRLDRINRLLSHVYGPLYALTQIGSHAWSSFRDGHRPYKGRFWKDGPPMSDADADAFRLWIRSVFMPLNRQMMELVVNRADP
jgi:hypothetical protein